MKTYSQEQAVLEEFSRYKIEGLTDFTAYDVHCLMVSALEGGSNYWYKIKKKTCNAIYNATPDMEGEAFVNRLIMAVQRGIPVRIHETEEDTLFGVLTKESWAKAEHLMYCNYATQHENVIEEEHDAITGDVFFQLAAKGEVVFG